MKFLSAVIYTTILHLASGAKVILIPSDHPGRVNFFILGGQALREKGHQVHVFTQSKYNQKILDAGLVHISYKAKDSRSIHNDPAFDDALENAVANKVSVTGTIKGLKIFRTKMLERCEEFLDNTDLMDQVAKQQFDLALVDAVSFSRCLYILPWMHHIKYISIALGMEPWAARVPAMPSIEPIPLLALSNEMSFFERVKNLLVSILAPYIIQYMNDESILKKYAGNRSERTYQEIFSDSEMFLNHEDILVLDYPRVSAPHYVFLGGMGGKPPAPLDRDLELFVSSADALVVVSFGSFLKLTRRIFDRLVAGFIKFNNVNFIMRYHDDVRQKVPQNVKVMKWLPQNDLIGHPKTKLFITHCGSNGQLESLYHGVPMLVAPLVGDQHHNALRIEKSKYGKILSLADESEKIRSAIQEVLTDETYRKTVQKASRRYRSLPLANETLAFWVDHVIRFGSDHIRPPYINMPLYKFFMLDVLCFFVVVLGLMLGMAYIVIRFILRHMCKRKDHVKQD